MCGLLASREWISVALRPGHKQAYVTFSARTKNNDWELTAWMYPVADKWMIGAFNIGMARLAGRSAADVLQLARNERTAGHGLNASLLYVALRALIDRGPNVHLAIAQEAEKDFATLEIPAEIRGTPPFVWNLGGKSYTVDTVTITGLEGKLGLIFMLPLTPWNGNDAADKYNREFLADFIAAHPEYARVFEFLAVRALTPDKSMGFGTVYTVKDGFDLPKPGN